MNKIYNQYVKLKEKDSKKVYLFKSGIFYISIDQDALVLSKICGFKLVNFNEKVKKCGFPVSQLAKYISILESNNVNFEIVDNFCVVGDLSEYIDSIVISEVIDTIATIDFNDISFKESFEILYKLNTKIKGNMNYARK